MGKTADSGWLTRQVTLSGLADLMFDPYAGDNKTQLRPDQKLYFDSDGKSLVLPAINIMSFLSSENTVSAPKRLLDSRQYRRVAQACKSFVRISPSRIPLCRDGKQIVFNGFDGDEDKKAGIYIHRSVARLSGGIPNPKVRPVIQCPWELCFSLSLFKNPELTEEQLQNLFINGGVAIGLGTYRGVFGSFEVSKWD